MDFTGRTVVVTGASAGIGAACATAFAAHGARLVLVARRLDRVEALGRGLAERHGVEVLTGVLDVRDRTAVDAWAASLEGPWGEVEVLVNNAGLARGLSPLQDGDPDDWDEMVDTNVKGLLYVTRALLPGMVTRGRGHLIMIGSIAGHEVYPGGNVYCATKHAVAALTRSIAIDTLGTGVRVSSVDPGLVETEFSTVRFHGDDAKAAAVYRGLQPLRPEDVADAVLYCAGLPPHVNVREMVLMPSAQASAVNVHRRTE